MGNFVKGCAVAMIIIGYSGLIFCVAGGLSVTRSVPLVGIGIMGAILAMDRGAK